MPMMNIQFEVAQDVEIDDDTIEGAVKEYLGDQFDDLDNIQDNIDDLQRQLNRLRAAPAGVPVEVADLIHEQTRASIDELGDFARALLSALDKTRTELKQLQRREQYRDAQIAELFRLTTTPWWKRLFGG